MEVRELLEMSRLLGKEGSVGDVLLLSDGAEIEHSLQRQLRVKRQ